MSDVTPADERPHASDTEGFSSSVTFAFGDAAAGVCATARLGLTPAGVSGLLVVFDGEDVAAVRADNAPLPEPTGGVGLPAWEDVRVAGLSTSVDQPLRAWTLRAEGDDAALELAFEARSGPARLAAGTPAGKAGGMQGYEQLCAVRGTVELGGRRRDVSCLGQRGHSWGAPDWERIALARTLSAWLAEDRGVSLTAVRPAKARTHADEAVGAFLFVPAGDDLPGGDDDLAGVIAVDDPRLSTTYDAEERQHRAGLELWVGGDDEIAHRAAGEVVCGTTLQLGRLRLDASFFRWRMEGREGLGRYDVLRRL